MFFSSGCKILNVKGNKTNFSCRVTSYVHCLRRINENKFLTFSRYFLFASLDIFYFILLCARSRVWRVLSFPTYPDQASSASQCPPYTRRPFPQYPPLQNILLLKNIPISIISPLQEILPNILRTNFLCLMLLHAGEV